MADGRRRVRNGGCAHAERHAPEAPSTRGSSSIPSMPRSTRSSWRRSTGCSTRRSRSADPAAGSRASGRPGRGGGRRHPAPWTSAKPHARRRPTPDSTSARSPLKSPARSSCVSSTRAPSRSTTRSATTSTGSPALDGITLEQLCRHTSGLADYYPGLRSRTSSPTPCASGRPTNCSRTASPSAASARRASRCAYSRTGILLLALALEEATPASLERPREAVRRRAARPRGHAVAAAVHHRSSRASSARTRLECRGRRQPCATARARRHATQSSSMGGVAAGAVSSSTTCAS